MEALENLESTQEASQELLLWLCLKQLLHFSQALMYPKLKKYIHATHLPILKFKPGGWWGTSYVGLYREAVPKRGTFLML